MISVPPARIGLATFGLGNRGTSAVFSHDSARLRRRKWAGVPGVATALALLVTACGAAVESGSETDRPAPTCDGGHEASAPDPCNRQGSGWEGAPGCLCALECPDRAPDCVDGVITARYARVCSAGVCSVRATCGPDAVPPGQPYPVCLTPAAGCGS